MKKHLIMMVLMVTMFANTTFSQDVELPRLSPKASVGYTIGLTDVHVTYGSPAVKGRTIWGNVVPYDKIWRAGANEATIVEFSTDVNMEGQTLRAGKYALFLIPGETEWTVIFNKKYDQWGSYNYDEAEDAIRFTVEPKMNEGVQERLTYSIHDMKMDMGYIKLAWDRMRLFMRFKVNVMETAMANLLDALESTPEDRKWIVYAEGAEFMMEAEGSLDQALEWAKKSTDRHTSSWNWYIRAQVEAKKGDMVSAVASGTKCAEIGLADENDVFYRENKAEVNSSIQGWAAKMN